MRECRNEMRYRGQLELEKKMAADLCFKTNNLSKAAELYLFIYYGIANVQIYHFFLAFQGSCLSVVIKV